MREIKHLLQQPLLIVYIRDFLILISNDCAVVVRSLRCEVMAVLVLVYGQINITITGQDNDCHHLDKWILITTLTVSTSLHKINTIKIKQLDN